VEAAQLAIAAGPRDRDARIVLVSALILAGQSNDACRLAAGLRAEDPGFSVDNYVAAQPYKDPATARRLAGSLRAAGLR
jgi:hypothetical protein